jgi:hypothetical protein
MPWVNLQGLKFFLQRRPNLLVVKNIVEVDGTTTETKIARLIRKRLQGALHFELGEKYAECLAFLLCFPFGNMKVREYERMDVVRFSKFPGFDHNQKLS